MARRGEPGHTQAIVHMHDASSTGHTWSLTDSCPSFWSGVRALHSQVQAQEQAFHQISLISNHVRMNARQPVAPHALVPKVPHSTVDLYLTRLHPPCTLPLQVLGMLLAYFVVAVVCWSMAATLAPFFESFLMNYNSLLATIVFTMYTLYCNYSTSLDPLRGYHNLERVVSYSLFWVLEDSPLETYWPLLGAAAVMHMVTQLQYSLQYNPSVWVLFVAYKALGKHGCQTCVHSAVEWVPVPLIGGLMLAACNMVVTHRCAPCHLSPCRRPDTICLPPHPVLWHQPQQGTL
jgi:hypothetical protein